MAHSKRVFILGAGFSKPARMPLANELLSPLLKALRLDEKDEMREWLDGLRERLAWLYGGDREGNHVALNIEGVFHHAHFDIEVHRLRQHLAPVGRRDGPGTPYTQGESIDFWLGILEEKLCDVILESDDGCELTPIKHWARAVNDRDAVLTFNYDTLAERALTDLNSAARWRAILSCVFSIGCA